MITTLTKQGGPFRIKIYGSNLQSGLRVVVDGSLWSNVSWKNEGKIVLKGGSVLKAWFPKDGSWTPIRLINPDGGEVCVEYNASTKAWRFCGG